MVRKSHENGHPSDNWRPLDDMADAAAVARQALVHAMAAASGNELEQLTDPFVLSALKLYVDIATKAAPYVHARKESVDVTQRVETTLDLPSLRSRIQELLQLEAPIIEGEVARSFTESDQSPPDGPTTLDAGHVLLFRGTWMFVRPADDGDTYQLWMRLGTGDDELIYDGEFTAVLAKAAELAEHDGPWMPDEWVILGPDGRVSG